MALYEREPDEKELAAFGFLPSDFGEQIIEVWPENWPAVQLFRRMGRRWVMGSGGATGLDFNVLYHMMGRMDLSPERFDELEAEIIVLEGAALQAIHAKSD